MTTQKNLHEPPRPPDLSLFIHAGTSGIRHIYPIHLTDSIIDNNDIFIRPISHLRSHTPTTDLCTNIEMIRNICLSIPTLEHLDISDNHLDNLPLDLTLLIHLQTLNCSYNRLTTINDLFEILEQLKDLNISFNSFKRLPNVLTKFQQLIRFNCEHNSLKNLDTNIIYLKQLKYLILDHNLFQTLSNIDFSQFNQLEYLHIAYNQLIKFPLNISKLTNLKNLNLSHNQLTTFPIELFLIHTLDVVNLSHNNLTKLSPLTDAYKRTTLIYSIDLSFNKIKKFYDYLILISLKIDLSNNQIEIIPYDSIRKYDYHIIQNRELKIYHNPLIQPNISMDILNNSNVPTINFLHLLFNSFEEQQQEIIRQGFQICIIGPKKSGKTSLAYCLEEQEDLPLIPEENQERMVNVLQFSFRFGLEKKSIIQQKSKKSRLQSIPSSILIQSKKTLPVTIFDFNGNDIYYQQISTFLHMNALYLICIHPIDFQQNTPNNLEDLFNQTYDYSIYPIIEQLFRILQILCEKVTEQNRLMIIPVVTHMDLYEQRSIEEKMNLLNRINEFFKLYLQFRLQRIQFEIKQIDSLPIISSSLSDRLKTYNSLLHLHIQIELCQTISSLSYYGIDELHCKIEHHVLTEKILFPNIDRILPTLWADTNRDIELLADRLSLPYLLWDDFHTYIIEQHGLKNLVDQIALSLQDQGKIIIINEIGTKNRLVFLRPLWLGDLLSCLFHSTFKHQFGHVHINDIYSLWKSICPNRNNFNQLCFLLMRFLLFAYPKMNKKELKNLIQNINNDYEMKFEDIIIPYYLPWLDFDRRQEEKRNFLQQLTHSVSTSIRCLQLPIGFFHRYSVLIILKYDFIYRKHWNNIIFGEHEEKKVQFLLESDHQTYLNCICGTTHLEQPFDQIWTVLMSILNQIEEMFQIFAPSNNLSFIKSMTNFRLDNQFHRFIQCPLCYEYSFLGEWTTPKELQGMKLKICSSCGEYIDTNYLIQPDERKRRNEELLKKIRERKAQMNQLISE